MLDNIYLFMLLRRYCWDGVFINFEYLLEKRILEKKEDVNFKKNLILYDKSGYILLYCVVVGGFLKIFKVIINVGD